MSKTQPVFNTKNLSPVSEMSSFSQLATEKTKKNQTNKQNINKQSRPKASASRQQVSAKSKTNVTNAINAPQLFRPQHGMWPKKSTDDSALGKVNLLDQALSRATRASRRLDFGNIALDSRTERLSGSQSLSNLQPLFKNVMENPQRRTSEISDDFRLFDMDNDDYDVNESNDDQDSILNEKTNRPSAFKHISVSQPQIEYFSDKRKNEPLKHLSQRHHSHENARAVKNIQPDKTHTPSINMEPVDDDSGLNVKISHSTVRNVEESQKNISNPNQRHRDDTETHQNRDVINESVVTIETINKNSQSRENLGFIDVDSEDTDGGDQATMENKKTNRAIKSVSSAKSETKTVNKKQKNGSSGHSSSRATRKSKQQSDGKDTRNMNGAQNKKAVKSNTNKATAKTVQHPVRTLRSKPKDKNNEDFALNANPQRRLVQNVDEISKNKSHDGYQEMSQDENIVYEPSVATKTPSKKSQSDLNLNLLDTDGDGDDDEIAILNEKTNHFNALQSNSPSRSETKNATKKQKENETLQCSGSSSNSESQHKSHKKDMDLLGNKKTVAKSTTIMKNTQPEKTLQQADAESDNEDFVLNVNLKHTTKEKCDKSAKNKSYNNKSQSKGGTEILTDIINATKTASNKSQPSRNPRAVDTITISSSQPGIKNATKKQKNDSLNISNSSSDLKSKHSYETIVKVLENKPAIKAAAKTTHLDKTTRSNNMESDEEDSVLNASAKSHQDFRESSKNNQIHKKDTETSQNKNIVNEPIVVNKEANKKSRSFKNLRLVDYEQQFETLKGTSVIHEADSGQANALTKSSSVSNREPERQALNHCAQNTEPATKEQVQSPVKLTEDPVVELDKRTEPITVPEYLTAYPSPPQNDKEKNGSMISEQNIPKKIFSKGLSPFKTHLDKNVPPTEKNRKKDTRPVADTKAKRNIRTKHTAKSEVSPKRSRGMSVKSPLFVDKFEFPKAEKQPRKRQTRNTKKPAATNNIFSFQAQIHINPPVGSGGNNYSTSAAPKTSGKRKLYSRLIDDPLDFNDNNNDDLSRSPKKQKKLPDTSNVIDEFLNETFETEKMIENDITPEQITDKIKNNMKKINETKTNNHTANEKIDDRPSKSPFEFGKVQHSRVNKHLSFSYRRADEFAIDGRTKGSNNYRNHSKNSTYGSGQNQKNSDKSLSKRTSKMKIPFGNNIDLEDSSSDSSIDVDFGVSAANSGGENNKNSTQRQLKQFYMDVVNFVDDVRGGADELLKKAKPLMLSHK